MTQLNTTESNRWDCIALGEVMLRLDPGEDRIRTARTFRPHAGGGEFNVAAALARVFGRRTSIATTLVDNDVGHLVAGLIRETGVSLDHVVWTPFDGRGEARVGINLTERGFGIRPPRGISDRAGSAASRMRPGDVDWSRVLEGGATRVLHCGGVFASLSPQSADLTLEGMKAARAVGATASFDLNYRPSLWQTRGGRAAAMEVFAECAATADMVTGNAFDVAEMLGTPLPKDQDPLSLLDPDATRLRDLKDHLFHHLPRLQMAAVSVRDARTASRHSWGGALLLPQSVARSRVRHEVEVLDRVGSGDAFAAGVIGATLEGRSPAHVIELGVALGALTMTTPGDVATVTRNELEQAVLATDARGWR